MQLIVTRPALEAQAWLQDLSAAGHTALCLPLIDIASMRDTSQLAAAWQDWHSFQAVMFVSAQAVRMFFAQRPEDTALDSTPCWATGLGTRRALLQAGVAAHCIFSPPDNAAQFDSEALWDVVQAHLTSDKAVLIVRGRDSTGLGASDPANIQGAGRDWLAQQLQARGVPVQWLLAYERVVPRWTPQQLTQAQTAATNASVWLLTSSQAVANLRLLLPQQDWSQALCLATHERVAQAAKALGFAQCWTCRPVLSDVLEILSSQHPRIGL